MTAMPTIPEVPDDVPLKNLVCVEMLTTSHSKVDGEIYGMYLHLQ